MSRLVAQRYTPPVKPSPAQAPGFRKVKADIAAKKTRLTVHAPAATESKSAQDAAVAPPDDREAQGKAANAEKMNAAKPGEFNKQAFIDAVNKAIDAQAPKNLDQADKFSKSGKADQIKNEVDGKVTDGKTASAKDIDTTTKAPPDTTAAKDKPVTPMSPDQPPPNPGAPPAADAVPDKQPPAVTDFSQGPAANDQAMADAEVTEDQLAKGNEPEFDQALSAKKTAETDSAKAPAKGRAAENQQLTTAKAGAAASGAQALSTLTATRASAGKHVDGGKNETKTRDEKRRAEATAKLQKVYDTTKKDVETTLTDLDKKVDTAFTTGEKAARDAFTADHKRRMKAYKDKRYSGMFGGAKWAKDKLMGMPKEADNLFQEARKLYVAKMQTVISSVADIIGTELGRAKTRIAKGRAELKAEVDKLPADLRGFGQDAAKDFAGKFDDLESTVNEKSEQLVQDLAQKYTAALNKVDEEIKKLQEANKGLVDKAKDAIVGVIKTINELKNLLLNILARAAAAIMKIIKDPIGFLGNLVKAVGAGLHLFITNIADHLKTGLVSWLLGTAVKAGLELPQRFDLKGIIQLIGALLGLTWANIRTRITRKGIPEQALTTIETSVPVAKKLATEGPAGAVNEITQEAGDLKATILEKLTTYLIPTVLIAGITWIISLLNPASAFVRAVKGIIDIVTFIVNQGAQIVDFVNAVLDAVTAIANGGAAGVPKMVETALATSIPLLIGFLASLLGISGLANKVKSVFHTVAKPVNRAIDKIINLITKAGKKLWNKLKPKKSEKNKNPAREGKADKEDSRNPNQKSAAVHAAIQDVEKLMRSNEISKGGIEKELPRIKRKRGLKELRLINSPDGSYRAHAKINPEEDSRPHSDVGLVGENFEKHAEILIGKVHADWWDKQLGHPEATEGKLWENQNILLPTRILAQNYIKKKEVHKKIAHDYYSDGRSDPKLDHFYNRVLGNSECYARKDVVDLLGRGALNTLRKVGLTRARKPGDEEIRKELRRMRFLPEEGIYGRFLPFPKGTKAPDPNLEKAINEVQASPREKIIEFLRIIMEGGSIQGIDWPKFKELWDTHSNSKAYVKSKFREADGGKHEWITTDYIPKVLEFAVDHRKKNRLKEAQDWLTLHHKLRSFTSDVIYRIEVPEGTGLVTRGVIGAHVGAFIKTSDRKFTFNEGDGPWHDGLRKMFDDFVSANPAGTAIDFLDKLAAQLPESGTLPEISRLIWDPKAHPIAADMRNVKVDAIYRMIKVTSDGARTVDEHLNIELGELEDLQRLNYDRVRKDFKEARKSLTGE